MSSPTLAKRTRLLFLAISLGTLVLVRVLAVGNLSAAAGNSTLPDQPAAVPMVSINLLWQVQSRRFHEVRYNHGELIRRLNLNAKLNLER